MHIKVDRYIAELNETVVKISGYQSKWQVDLELQKKTWNQDSLVQKQGCFYLWQSLSNARRFETKECVQPGWNSSINKLLPNKTLCSQAKAKGDRWVFKKVSMVFCVSFTGWLYNKKSSEVYQRRSNSIELESQEKPIGQTMKWTSGKHQPQGSRIKKLSLRKRWTR